jgi:hypothetical protein
MNRMNTFALVAALCLAPFGACFAQDAMPSTPRLDDATLIEAIVPQVSLDAEVARVVGESIPPDAHSYGGTIDLSGRDDGGVHARLVFELAGAKGRAAIDVVAAHVDGRWEIVQLDVSGR